MALSIQPVPRASLPLGQGHPCVLAQMWCMYEAGFKQSCCTTQLGTTCDIQANLGGWHVGESYSIDQIDYIQGRPQSTIALLIQRRGTTHIT